ncbi:MAG: hypothetical protein LBT58_03190 [Endomicrobium sp.]|jgi:hypothetical protein|nr:hypothetical protein [Endomicrobium sp.]
MAQEREIKELERAVAKENFDKVEQEREKIELFYQREGLNVKQEAYEVKRSTLFNWQKKNRGYGIVGLINGDRV